MKFIMFPIFFAFLSVIVVAKGWQKLLGESQLSPFCAALSAENKTLEDFKRNWHPQPSAISCQGGEGASSCQKKHDAAFAAGLNCYERH